MSERNELLMRAEESVKAAEALASRDPTRPVYHFRPPANWMNDPNGPIYYRGWYHLFYQHNPYGDRWGNMHWGHSRSRDLVHWERLPIALWPSRSKGEQHVFSGSAALDGRGVPMLFYTSIGHPLPEMWSAVPEDGELLKWRKHPRNPLLVSNSQGTQFDDWRDPFVFRAGSDTYVVHGGNLNQAKGGQAVVSLYRARNPDLTEWDYRGILFRHPDSTVVNIECPNFFPLGDKWALIVSPHRACDYFVGNFDPAAGTFTSNRRGMVDYSDQFYAPNGLQDAKGRRILWGWIRGFTEGRGWNGCLSVPRVLSVDADGYLKQEPAPELKRLRGRKARLKGAEVNDRAEIDMEGNCLELTMKLDLKSARRAGVRLRASQDGQRAQTIAFDGDSLEVPGQKVTLPAAGGRSVSLHIFLDRSVLEVFADNGRVCVTRVIYPEEGDLKVELFAEGGTARFRDVQAWNLKPAF